MLKQILIAVPLAITASAGSDCFSQSDVAKNDSILDSAEAEFRELIFERAADFSDANQESAIRSAKNRNSIDERFNAVIRQVLQDATKPDHWDVKKLSRAVDLLPLSTLTGKEQAEMVFRCYLKCDDGRADSGLKRDLKKRLALYPNETSRLLKERISSGDYPPSLLALVSIVGTSSEGLLPMLLKAAKSDDPALAGWAMSQTEELLDRLRKMKADRLSIEELQSLGGGAVDDKMVTYAKRIVQRYDTNGDLRLSPPEYEKMLMSPVAADRNQDGQISVLEYAVFMQSRSKR